MSGRKQHYIPQFAMRGFAVKGRGKYEQVKVYKRDRSFFTSTEGVGAEREFYSKLRDDGEETLDDIITEAETEYAEIHQSLLNAPVNAEPDGQSIARLVCHLSVRGNNLRDSLTVGGRYAIAKSMEMFADSETCKQMLGLAGQEPSRKLRAKLDELYDEHKPKLRTLRMSRHDFRRFAFKHAKDNWDANFQSSVRDMLASYPVVEFSRIAAEAHNKVLTESLEPEARVAALGALPWKLIETEIPLILPDSVGIAHDDDQGPIPVSYCGADGLKGVFVPLTPHKAVCGGIYGDAALLNFLLPKFHTLAAYNSWDFFVASPATEVDATTPKLIGECIARVIASAIADSIEEAMIEGLTV